MVNGALGSSLEYSVYSLGRILKAPFGRNFLKAIRWPHPRPDRRPEPLGACGPSGFWPFVWPWMWPRVRLWKIPWGTFNLLPREYIDYSWETP